MSSYEDWRSLYSPEMENIGLGKSKHLRKLDLLLHVFEREVAIIKKYMHNEYKSVELSLLKENKPSVASTTSTTLAKPVHLRLKKSPLSSSLTNVNKVLPPPKDSPDLFNQSTDANIAHSLNQNIQGSDVETIMSSPEKYSPKIKKKRILRQNKTKELGEAPRQSAVGTPKENGMDCDTIQGTPDVRTFFKSTVKTTAKKKLFEKSAPKKSQSMYTLSQMYKNQSLKSKTSGIPLKDSNMCIRSSQTLNEQNDDKSGTILEIPNESTGISVDDLLENIANEQNVDDNTLVCNTFKEVCEKQKCRICAIKRSPCPKHKVIMKELKEPDQTFTGFWDMNFTLNKNNIIKKGDKPEDEVVSQNSTIFGF